MALRALRNARMVGWEPPRRGLHAARGLSADVARRAALSRLPAQVAVTSMAIMAPLLSTPSCCAEA
eukprot:3826684-Lingulodinium_polyedra.AAC.1